MDGEADQGLLKALSIHGIHWHVQDALYAQPFLLPGYVLLHRPLKQGPGHGVKELGYVEVLVKLVS